MEGTSLLVLGFVWVLNFAISWWNAYAVGCMWPYTKATGGWQHWLAWMGFIMAGAGFSWCWLLVLSIGAYHFSLWGFGLKQLQQCLSLGYLILAPTIVFSGLFVWLDSLAQAWRERSITSVAAAGWNTYAQISNTISVVQNLGSAWDSVSSIGSPSSSSSSDDEDGNAFLLTVVVVVCVVMSLVIGFVMASVISNKAARTAARELDHDLKAALPERTQGSLGKGDGQLDINDYMSPRRDTRGL